MSIDERQRILSDFTGPEWVEIGPDVSGETFPGTARSYLADGRGIAWKAPATDGCALAIDAELADQPVSPMLAQRTKSFDPEVVWPLWTACEAAAKALDLPVLSWLNWPGLKVPDDVAQRVLLKWERRDDVLLCYGVARLD
ncbi:hypothetical protein [Calidifontibacter terrae]